MTPSPILSIDPGARGAGAALWYRGELFAAAYVKNPLKKGIGPREAARLALAIEDWEASLPTFDGLVDGGAEDSAAEPELLVLEWPQTYGGRSTRGDTNDLFPLAALDGALAAIFEGSEIRAPTPHAWKNNIPKPLKLSEPYIIRERAEARLSEAERSRIVWPKNVKHTWDVADALGLGLWALGRFDAAFGRLSGIGP